ncbi:hypothetical protein B0H14DRAFT_3045929, partial [Mycena olivaceomarginata]
MKVAISLGFVASIVSILPVAHALVGSSWSVTNVPATGLTDITFPLTIVEADHISGYYLLRPAIQLRGIGHRQRRKGGPPRGVLELRRRQQPRATRTCHTGADGGPGVSCAVE